MPGLIYFEMPIGIYLTMDFLLFFFTSNNRLFYIFSPQSFISYLTLIPTMLLTFGVVTDRATISAYELTFWKVFRILSLSRLDKVFVRNSMTIKRIQFKLAFSLFAIIILFASSMLVVENKYFIEVFLESIAYK